MITALRSRAKLELNRLALDPYCKLYLPLRKLDGDSFMSKDAYGHLCTNYGSLWTPQGRSFDGVDDYVDCGNKPSLDLTKWTIEFWTRVNVNKDYNGFVIKGLDGSENWEILGQGDGTVILTTKFTDGTRGELITPADTIITGEWAHFVYTYDQAQGRRFYRNSSLIAEDTESKTPKTTTEPLYIGNEKGVTRFLDGLIGEVCIYSRDLTLQEILCHYLVGKEMFG